MTDWHNTCTYFPLVTREFLSYNMENLCSFLNIGYIFLREMLIEHLLSILLADIGDIRDA